MESRKRDFHEWYRRHRVLILAAYITLGILAIILLSGCRESDGKTPEPAPGPAVVTPNE